MRLAKNFLQMQMIKKKPPCLSTPIVKITRDN
jgi:hypothetical protein